MDINNINIRKEYHSEYDPQEQKLILEQTPIEPMHLFTTWYQDAVTVASSDCDWFEPYAMTLSTVKEITNDNKEEREKKKRWEARSRIVLMREFSIAGIVFYTNYLSDKGKEIAAYPMVGLNFYWPVIQRQVRIEGEAIKVNSAESERYFYSRPPSSRIGSAISKQSALLNNRQEFLKEIADCEKTGGIKSCPKHWGGYRVVPNYIEFWLGRESRFHERLVYKKNLNQQSSNNWDKYLLYP